MILGRGFGREREALTAEDAESTEVIKHGALGRN
jgi:hypothetical protein